MKGCKVGVRSEEHTSELQSPDQLVCRLLLEKKKRNMSCHLSPINKRNSVPEQRNGNLLICFTFSSSHRLLSIFQELFFFFNDTATIEIYTLSLHDALPILNQSPGVRDMFLPQLLSMADPSSSSQRRSEEHTSELQSPDHLVCRLLLEK